MASQIEALRRNQQMEMDRQIAAQNFAGPEVAEVANGIPVSNDAALAAHLAESRAKSAEYARLATEESRQQWEAMAADNFRRDQANKDQIKTQAAVETMNRTASNIAEGERLFSEWQAVTKDIKPDETEWTLSLDKLKDLANTDQKLTALLASVDPNAKKPPKIRPEDASTVTDNGDGTWTVVLPTREVFKGTAPEVMQAQAAAQVNGRLWAEHKVAQLKQQQAQQQPAAELNEQPTEQNYSGSLSQDLAARQADALAQQFGFSDKNEMMQWGESVSQKMATIQDYENEKLATRFCADNPDFPGTPEAVNAVTSIVENNGWEWNAESLKAAHLLAARNHIYEPLSAEMIQAASGTMPQNTRPAPPPMLSGNNPELSAHGSNDPYQIPLAELRRQAMQQELEGKGPNYR
jgi:hypothetical protein